MTLMSRPTRRDWVIGGLAVLVTVLITGVIESFLPSGVLRDVLLPVLVGVAVLAAGSYLLRRRHR